MSQPSCPNELPPETQTARDNDLLDKTNVLSEDNGHLEQQLKSLRHQLEQERQETVKYKQLLDSEQEKHNRTVEQLQQQVSTLKDQLSQQDGQQRRGQEVSTEPNSAREDMLARQVNSLREAASLCKKMLSIRDEEVDLLKKQLQSTELKVEAFKEKYEMKKKLILEEIRAQAVELAAAKNELKKWTELCSSWENCEHPDDVEISKAMEVGAQNFAEKLYLLLSDRKQLKNDMDELKQTNLSLVKALAHHESKLTTVTTQLDQTWAWLSRLKLQHGQLQSEEIVLRYELKEKRKILESLKNQLELSRQKWNEIRQQNDQNQTTLDTIRQDLNTRKTPDEIEGSQSERDLIQESDASPVPVFVPPIDLVSDIVSNDKPIAASAVGREERLQIMEEQCRHLYSKLVNATTRNAALVGRLASLHNHYSRMGNTESETPGDTDQPENVLEQETQSGLSEDNSEMDNLDMRTTEDQQRGSACHSLQKEHLRCELEHKEHEVSNLKDQIDALKAQSRKQEKEQEQSAQALAKKEKDLQIAHGRLCENEQLVSALQRELQQLASQLKEEKANSDAMLNQLQIDLNARSKECEDYKDKLILTAAALDELKASQGHAEIELEQARAVNCEMSSQLKQQHEESSQLKDRVIELIRDKDFLWKKSDMLLHWQRIHAQNKWIPDEATQNCHGCETQFTFFNRRHHCRLCGRIYCHTCSNYWLSIPASSKLVRICSECLVIHNQLSSITDSAQLLVSKQLHESPDGEDVESTKENSEELTYSTRAQSDPRPSVSGVDKELIPLPRRSYANNAEATTLKPNH